MAGTSPDARPAAALHGSAAGRASAGCGAGPRLSRLGPDLGSYYLPLGFTLTAAQQLFLTQFEQPLALFGPDPPNTRLWFSRLQVHNRLIQLGGFSPSLSFIREASRANLTIYSYERYRLEGGFVRVF